MPKMFNKCCLVWWDDWLLIARGCKWSILLSKICTSWFILDFHSQTGMYFSSQYSWKRTNCQLLEKKMPQETTFVCWLWLHHYTNKHTMHNSLLNSYIHMKQAYLTANIKLCWQYQQCYLIITLQLVGGLEHVLFSHILGMSSSQLTNSYFSEG